MNLYSLLYVCKLYLWIQRISMWYNLLSSCCVPLLCSDLENQHAGQFAVHVLKPCIVLKYGLVGLVVKASASRAEDLGFESCLQRDISGIESYQ